jgi:Mg-chelatase subunit ChlI
VVDLLLDSAAMGVNVVEREGISFSHPARFILIGTMNPEEGDLRPQLLDRFALSVDVHGIADAPERMEILQRHIAYEENAEKFRTDWAPEEQKITDKIAAAREIVDDVEYTRRDLYTIATLTSGLHIDGHRADLVILKAARAHAAWMARTYLENADILLAAELALPHRLKRGPFSDAQMSSAALQEKMEQVSSEWGEGDESTEPSESDEQNAVKKKVNQ